MFKPVNKTFDVPALEHEVMSFWELNDIERRYLDRNRESNTHFSFLDGPITANGPMGVHHAWGRTYKDLWQRYNSMQGKKQRFQNGFDCQGLWVEVTVERKLGFTSKKDIEQYGVANFVRACKADVLHWANVQTERSRRLGYFMDWDNSYFTMSDENNFTIWHFLKRCHQQGLIYRGTDVMPWCTRCGTGLSEHEIATEGYQDVTHTAVYVRMPLIDRPGESLLIWTTTPWTLTSNVAVAVNPKFRYLKVQDGDQTLYVARGALQAIPGSPQILDELNGDELLGWRYAGPFDELPAQHGVQHVVIPWDEVSEEEGTGLVHIAPGCGKEDFALGKQFQLPVIAPIDQNGIYLDGFAWLSGRAVSDVAVDIVADLRAKGLLQRAQNYTHRYPTCWRCGTELVFRLVDEWFISMDPLRQPMMDAARKIRWIPAFGLEREIDWLRNMDDWMISKKRYWGLALPFWICPSNHLTVIGGRKELEERALDGMEHLESPHRPWIDEVTIQCPECGEVATRVPDVGNPWLDAGIVPYSTLNYDSNPDNWREWFPADFITESFPGQFRNWFYSMIAMSAVLENTNPFTTVLGYALMRDEQGRDMHKSWGNLIPFDEAADRAGADVMRWLFVQHNVENNLNFGWRTLDAVKRKLLILWNTYSFFVTYANLDGWEPSTPAPAVAERPDLDRWILARLNRVIAEVRGGLDDYDCAGPGRAVDGFIEELSTWYVRRSRRRFWKSENDSDKLAAYATLYTCLVTLTKLLAPFMPFVAEHLYQNLVRSWSTGDPLSVHLTDYPQPDRTLIDDHLVEAMDASMRVVALGRAAREQINQKVRQPLARIFVRTPDQRSADGVGELSKIILDELNVKELRFAGPDEEFVSYSVRPNLPVLGPRFGRSLPDLKAALAALDPDEVARALRNGDTIEIEVQSEKVHLSANDILVSAEQREGFGALSENGYLVALDAHLTPELLREGRAREIVRCVNDLRKSAGFNIDDRILVRYEAGDQIAEAIEEFGNYISQETLAVEWRRETLTGTGYAADVFGGNDDLRVELVRATTDAVRSADALR